MAATFLIGYDVESKEPVLTRAFLEAARRVHEDLELPCTLFIAGRTLRHSPDAFAALLGHPLFDLEQHTDTHLPLKTVYQETDRGITVVRGGQVSSIWADVAAAQRTFQKFLGFRPIGMTAPYGYYRGLCDRPDLVSVLVEEGIRFLRSWGRNAHDWQPTSPFRPFSLAPLGFPEVWEYGMHGWQDCLLREQLGWTDLDGYFSHVRADLDRVVAEHGVFSYCQHDWSSVCADPELQLTRRILSYVRERGMRVVSYRADYSDRHRRTAVATDAGKQHMSSDWQRRLLRWPARVSGAYLRRLDRVSS